MKFSKKKFVSFTVEKKVRIIRDFIHEIEQNWISVNLRTELILQLQKCMNWSDDKDLNVLSERISIAEELDEFLTIMIPWEQQNYRELRDHDFLIFDKDDPARSANTIDLTIILYNLRSAFNVGSILRTSECIGVKKIVFCGYTPTPENKKVQVTSMGTYEHLQWDKSEDISAVIRQYKEQQCTIYGLETTSNAVDIYKNEISSPAVLILGNEAYGIPRNILEQCDNILKIPVAGWKNSLNVGVAFAVCGYEIFRQWELRD